MSYDVVIKSLPQQWIGSVREVIPAYGEVGSLIGKVAAGLGPSMIQSTVPVALWHDPEYKQTDVDAEAGFYFKEAVSATNGVEVYELPETTAASTIHNGSYRRLPEAYDALFQWVAANGYQVVGPLRELYLHCPAPVTQDNESYITEIQAPVKKAAS